MIKIIGLLTVILFFLLLPPAILAYASSDSLPGEVLYPVKRSLESVILSAASLNPNTKALFSNSLSNTRFKEVTALINKGDNTQASESLNELVVQTSDSVNNINDIENVSSQKELAESLIASIDEYDKSLEAVSIEAGGKSFAPKVVTTTTSGTAQNPSPTATTQSSTPVPLSTPPSTQAQIKDEKLVKDISETREKLKKEKERIEKVLETSEVEDEGNDTEDLDSPVDPEDEAIDDKSWKPLFNQLFGANDNQENGNGKNDKEERD